MNKIILITDCFVKSPIVEYKLINFLEQFNKHFEICLVSNTTLSPEIQSRVNYYLYDSNNRLFSKNFDNIEDIIVFREDGNHNFRIETIVSGNQPHGLSVLVNLFNQLEYCRSLGYTHVLRLEIDMTIQDDFIPQVSSHIDLCLKQSKLGFFYKSTDSVICQYFFCQIDYFLDNVYKVKSEEDYKKFLTSRFGNNNFMPVERFLFENLNSCTDLIFKTETELHLEFSNTTWNTEVSQSHLDPKYEGCLCNLVRVSHNNKLMVFSESFSNKAIGRTIKVFLDNNESYDINVNLAAKGFWSFANLPDNVSHIQVFDNERFLFDQRVDQINSRFIDKNFKRIYFDIGCNIGDYTETLRNTLDYDKIIMIDANPQLIERAKIRFAEDPKIEALNYAVSSDQGMLDFYICNSCDVISTCEPGWVNDSRFSGKHSWDSVIKVQSISIDELISQYGVPQFIKIDVEGYEFNVVKSMSQNYGAEIHFEWSEERLDDIVNIVEYLGNLGYTKFGCMHGDKYDGRPEQYLEKVPFIDYMRSICDYQRRSLWGMIYCTIS